MSKQDPKLTKVAVQVKYWSDDGYKMDLVAKSGEGTTHRITGEPVPPQKALIEGLTECLRLLMLFGFEAEADAAIAGVKERMADFKASRAG